jgi:hypothetical protein
MSFAQIPFKKAAPVEYYRGKGIRGTKIGYLSTMCIIMAHSKLIMQYSDLENS